MIKLNIGDYIACTQSLQQLCTCGIVGIITEINEERNTLYIDGKLCNEGYKSVLDNVKTKDFIHESKVNKEFDKALKGILK